MRRLILLLFGVSLQANCQWLSVGVTGAVPISPHSAPTTSATIEVRSGDSILLALQPVTGINDFYQKPYGVGPTVYFNLPWNLSIEAGMLYERFHRDAISGLTAPHGGPVNFGYVFNTAADAFAFPLLASYSFGHRRTRPFVEAGATLRHLSSYEGGGVQLDIYLHPIPVSFRFDPDKALDVAVTAGAGFRYSAGVVELVPEVRFLHWTSQTQQPVQNQAMVTLTIAFPAKRR